MKTQFYYIVEYNFWRRKIGDKLYNHIYGIDYSEAIERTVKVFKEGSLLESRRKAFNHFQSIIEVLYNALEKEYIDDYNARIDLQHFLDSDNHVEIFKDNPDSKFKVSDDFLNGIELYMVVEKPIESLGIKANSKFCIHGIRYQVNDNVYDEDIIENLKNLILEYQVYEELNHDCGNNIELNHFEKIGMGAEFTLKTPFDWDRFLDSFEEN